MRKGIRLSPAMVVALVALFFALGGSAFALGTKTTPQPRCAQGAVRGVLEVTGQPAKGVANLPDQFTSVRSYFGHVFNCNGGPVQARRLSTGVYDVRFVGNPAASAVASAMGGDATAASVQRNSDGSFHVTLGGESELRDVPFTVVVL